MVNRIALITGAGRGIGAATAIRLATEGFDICLNYRQDDEAVDKVLEKVVALGVRGLKVRADISDESQVLGLFDELDKHMGPLSVLVNNAGVLYQQMPLLDMTAARINKTLAINVTGTMLCSREAVRRMSVSSGGSGGAIINVSSAASRLGSPFEYVDYAASKGAIDTFTIGLAREVASLGIRVNAVRPGVIYTEMHSDGGEPDRVDRVKANVPMGRGGMPEEVAAAIAWLASDQSSYSTGSFIDVSGGR